MKTQCQCQDCGKTSKKGDEGDNETICLRCERESLISDLSGEEYEALDFEESDHEKI